VDLGVQPKCGVETEKILFYIIKKIVCGGNVVLRTVSSLYFNETQKLCSTYSILPWHGIVILMLRGPSGLFFYFISLNLVF